MLFVFIFTTNVMNRSLNKKRQKLIIHINVFYKAQRQEHSSLISLRDEYTHINFDQVSNQLSYYWLQQNCISNAAPWCPRDERSPMFLRQQKLKYFFQEIKQRNERVMCLIVSNLVIHSNTVQLAWPFAALITYRFNMLYLQFQ